MHLSLLGVRSAWQISFMNLQTEESCWFSLSGYICYNENMLKFSIGKEIIFLNGIILIYGQSTTPLFALFGNAKKR